MDRCCLEGTRVERSTEKAGRSCPGSKAAFKVSGRGMVTKDGRWNARSSKVSKCEETRNGTFRGRL